MVFTIRNSHAASCFDMENGSFNLFPKDVSVIGVNVSLSTFSLTK